MKALLFIVLTTIVPALAHALPYVGPDKKPCNVNEPTGEFLEINAGYITDENCENIYVKPPTVGNLYLNEDHFFEQSTLSYCKMSTKMRDIIASNEAKGSQESDNPDPMVPIRYFEIAARAEAARNKLINTLGTVATVAGRVNLGWASIVNEYKRLNPGKSVLQLPITFGAMSFEEIRYSDLEDDIYTNRQNKMVNRLVTSSAQVNSGVDALLNNLLPSNYGVLFANHYLMGQTGAFTVDLSLSGLCAMMDENGRITRGVASNFNPTYTYVYPVETKSLFDVSINIDSLKPKMQEIARSRGGLNGFSITIEEFKKELGGDGVGAFEITLKDGIASTQLAASLRDQYQKDLKDSAISAFLALASGKINSALLNAKYTEAERRSHRHCEKKFGIFKSCHTHYFTVNVEKINWNLVSEEIHKMVGGGVHSTAQQYQTVHHFDTLAFEPK